jgi:hypothetical protein
MDRPVSPRIRRAVRRWLLVAIVAASAVYPLNGTVQSAASRHASRLASGQAVADSPVDAPDSTASRFIPSITIVRPGDGAVLTSADTIVSARIHAPAVDHGYRVDAVDTWPDGTRHASFAIQPKGIGTIIGIAPTMSLTGTIRLRAGGLNIVELQLIGPHGLVAKDVIPVTVSVVTKPTDVAARGIEVTQAFSKPLAPLHAFAANKTGAYSGAPLVAGKSTVVRLYGTVPAGAGTVRGVEALLYGQDTFGADLPGSPISAVAGPLGTADARVTLDPRDTLIQQRLNPSKSWNFVLPSSWTDIGTITLHGVINPQRAIPESMAARANDDYTMTGVTFFPTSSLQIRPYFFTGTIGKAKTSSTSGSYLGASDPAFTNGWLNSIMPIADGSITVKPPANPTISSCVGGCTASAVFESLLATAQSYWLRDTALDPGTAFAPPASPYVLYDIQLASQIPGTIEGAAPIGGHALVATPRNARTTSYEILHDLGLPNAGNTAGARGEAWPFCEGSLALRCEEAPDTSTTSAGVTDSRPLAFDTSPARGDRTTWSTARDALDQAVVKDPLAHAPYAGLEPATPCKQPLLLHYRDVMSVGADGGNCSELGTWISTINYCRVFFTLSGLASPSAESPADFCKRSLGMLTPTQIAALASEAHIGGSATASNTPATRAQSVSVSSVGAASAPAQHYLEVSGAFASGAAATAKTVPSLDNTRAPVLYPMFVSDRPIASNATAASGLLGVLVSGTGTILAVQTVALHEVSDQLNPGWLSFSFELPLKAGAKQLLLVKTSKGHNTVLADVTRPATAPSLRLAPDKAGTSLTAGEPLTLAWTGSGSQTVYDVALSCDGGSIYQSLAVALEASTLAIDYSSLCGGRSMFRVAATNGFDSVVKTGGPYRSPFRPPSINLLRPGDGTSVPPVTQITLAGQAIVPPFGLLSGAQLAWTSDRDGLLGYGAVITTTSLSEGLQHITLKATAPDGNYASKTITLKVVRVHLLAVPARSP